MIETLDNSSPTDTSRLHTAQPLANAGKVFAILAIGVVAAGTLASCGALNGTITGSGVAESIIYDFETVDAVDVGGAFNADITIEQGPPSVEIIIDDDLAQYLQVEVKNGTLDVQLESGNYKFGVGPELIVTTPDLEALDLSGASDGKVTGLDAEAFKLDVSGASGVEIAGVAKSFEIDVSGASSVSIDGTAETVEIEASGASNADLSRLDAASVDVKLSGASDTELGEVTEVTGDLSGASSLQIDSGTNASVSSSGASSIDRR